MSRPPLDAVVGRSVRMREILDFVRIIADGESSVLITGESGTGKELIARLIHDSSPRRDHPFVTVSCASLAEALIESDLFSRAIEGGTLFLEDIDDVPPPMQVRLLRVLQTRAVERAGSDRPIPIDLRVLTGSKRDLRKLVTAGSFREDLFYRLNVIPIQLPPLRDRAEDIPLLVEHFFAKYFTSRGKAPRKLSAAMVEAFVRYPWPGNVRELENACERIAQTCICDAVVAGCVPAAILLQKPAPPDTAAEPAELVRPVLSPAESLDGRLAALETHLITSALRASRGNRSRAAQRLKIKRSTLGDRIRRLGLDQLNFDAGSS